MIIVEVMGGLGNQMQQYALYRKLESLGKDARLDVSWFLDKDRQTKVLASRKLELSWFENLPAKYCTQEEKQAILGKNTLVGKLKKKLLGGSNRHFTESDMYHPEIFDLEDAYLSGFWACEAYYADILPMLRSQIHFPDPEKGEGWDLEAAAKNKETMERMKQETSVSIHIRRGDYLDAKNAEMFGGICTDAYYEAAISYIKEQTPDAHFYVFSDDSAYVKNAYPGKEFTVVDWNTGKNSLFDMQLMSCCNHNICANSTFSFWGARLNPSPDKVMIRPSKHKNSQNIVPEEMKRLWDGWVLIDGKGRII